MADRYSAGFRNDDRAVTAARRLRSLGWFLLAGVYAIFARQLAERAASVLAGGPFFSLASRFFYVVLLLVGFAAMGVLGQRQSAPVAAMGLPRRPGFGREWALGAALGWAGIVVCVLPVALTGGLLVTFGDRDAGAVGSLLIDLLTLLLAALADEVLFRGYPFQRLIEATGPTLATILLTLLFTLGHGGSVGTTPGGFLVTMLLGFLLAMAYLRTRALWVGWGFHFAWTASMAVLFGLPVSGLTEFSPLFSTYTTGPAWLTGGGYGPEGSAVAFLVLLGLLLVMARVTRDLRHRWGHLEIVGAGIPVDLDAISQRQHEEGMGPGVAAPPPAGSQLVQIAPVANNREEPPV